MKIFSSLLKKVRPPLSKLEAQKPYIIEYDTTGIKGCYRVKVDEICSEWINSWEVIHFSFRHIILKNFPYEGCSIDIHPTDAKAIIKKMKLKKYGLLLQDGKKYRLEDWNPEYGQYKSLN